MLASILAAALLATAAPRAASAIQTTSLWASEGAERSPPGLELNPSCGRLIACQRANWAALLERWHLIELHAPAGGRAFRSIWMWAWEPGDAGFVELQVPASGPATIISSWRTQPETVADAKVAEFEQALAKKTDFSTLRSNEAQSCLDECQDQLFEAVVGGHYHYVERNGGIPRVIDAAVLLEKMAQSVARR